MKAFVTPQNNKRIVTLMTRHQPPDTSLPTHFTSKHDPLCRDVHRTIIGHLHHIHQLQSCRILLFFSDLSCWREDDRCFFFFFFLDVNK
uniref:Uncharacterized protein n=1 Tax=Helianthus annuus TaxID=4232 RepID=A0A251VSC3_HELAN